MKILKKQNISTIFNYSSIELTKAMVTLLNRGLNFAILPLKLDLTQVLVDFKRFERSIIWHEFWYGSENKEPYSPPIFRLQKRNLPKNHSTPKELKSYLSAIKSEITDPRNRNNVKCNLPVDEMNALKELIKLQRDRVIIVKPCDKGAGIIILDFNIYMKACYEHLLEKQSNTDGDLNYYVKVDEFEVERSKKIIKNVLNEALKEEIISKHEFQSMDPTDKNLSKFYMTFKVHKPHEPKTAPPPRPIVSGSGSITENLGVYVEHNIKHIANKHETYLQDTPHFLRIIEEINSGSPLPENAMLATCDITGAYTNIPQEDGTQVLREALDNTPKSDLVVKLMELILKHNLFEFHSATWKQEIGTAMGVHPAPSYANIYLAKRIDQLIIELAKGKENGNSCLLLFKRFLDDIFQIFQGTTKELHKLFDSINQIHPTLKFTFQHTTLEKETEEEKCGCEERKSIPFLDTSCSLEKGKIVVDLYRKESDRNQYLLTSSCHPIGCTKNIPFSLGLRIVRTCTEPETRDKRLSELKELLIHRDYPERLIDSALIRARAIPRRIALRKVIRKK